MLRSDEGEIDVFFDSANCLSSEESVVVGSGKLGYEIWMNEPQSVKERRESFLRGMAFSEFAASRNSSQEMEMEVGDPSKMMGLERLTECSGAVSSSCISSTDRAEENLVCCRREVNGEANVMLDELVGQKDGKQNVASNGKTTGLPTSAQEFEQREAQADVKECNNLDIGKKKITSFWKGLVNRGKERGSTCLSEVSKPNSETPKFGRMKVQQNKKTCMEFTALYKAQEIQAHKGFIWTMKFSPDGQYLASGGQDGVVRVWRVMSADASCKYLTTGGNFGSKVEEGKSSFGRKRSTHASVILPEKICQIEESPLQEFHGHTNDVLDLAWSTSNCLLSSSKDKTVRLWQVGCHHCPKVFHHNDYVTCIQFNPVDDNYFVSGSIDGKARIWGVSEGRVVDWADVRDVITAICYQPDGKGFIVGSIAGTCRFYETLGNDIQLNAEIHVQGRKKTSGNMITGIQYSQDESKRLMITSEDSKLRIFDGNHVIHKYRGLSKSGSQMSASFTPNGKHIVSVGEDSRVYVWNFDGLCIPSSKQKKSERSCEHFFSDGVLVAIPWSGKGTEEKGLGSGSPQHCSQRQDHQETAASWVRDSERFSLGNWFSMDGPCRGSATWPEEKLPVAEDEHHQHHQDHLQQQQCHNSTPNHTAHSETWGLVIVTAGWDGTIKAFHNYGLPVRL